MNFGHAHNNMDGFQKHHAKWEVKHVLWFHLGAILERPKPPWLPGLRVWAEDRPCRGRKEVFETIGVLRLCVVTGLDRVSKFFSVYT